MSKRAPLRCTWSKRERDFVYNWDKSKIDGNLLHCLLMFGLDGTYKDEVRKSGYSGRASINALRRDLEARGFDPDTFTISVRRKP